MSLRTDRHLTSRVHTGRISDVCDRSPRAAALLEVLSGRAARWVSMGTVCDADEPADWWHVCWERLGDVAFAHAMRPSDTYRAWLRDEVLRICALDPAEWIGPFFRAKTQPLVGSLETAHVGLAVCAVLELCPEIFDQAELRVIHTALVGKGLEPSRRWLNAHDAPPDPSNTRPPAELNNWYMVLLDGYGAMALATASGADIATLPARFERAVTLYQDDSYAESFQYWGYATLHLTHLYELLLATDTAGIGPATLDRVARTIPWVAHSVMFARTSSPWGDGAYTTMLNFGDSAITQRPPADTLLCLAHHLNERNPREAGLSRWLFELTYADVELEPTDLASFGFFNQITWRSLAHWADAAEPLPPDDAALPTTESFSCGTVVARDRWNAPRSVLAARNGHDTLTTVSHRHRDQGSFILGHLDEVFFTDPGHCCYRLQAQQAAKDSSAHSTWTFADQETGHPMTQRSTLGTGPLGTRFGPWTVGGLLPTPVTVFGADIADAYDTSVLSARRTWFSWLPHVVLVVDEIETTTPVTVHSKFVLNNRDNNLRTNQATDSRLVFRRGDAAVKFFQLQSETDGHPSQSAARTEWSALHDIYDPHPNAPGQGKEGSGQVHVFSTAHAGRRHRAIYSIVMDHDDSIRNWHLTMPDRETIDLGLPDETRRTVTLDQLMGITSRRDQ